MSPEAQRIAIAEACGWKVTRNGLSQITIVRQAKENEWHILDPLNDLNAMHEAEKMLTSDQREVFVRAIHIHATGAGFKSTWDADWLILHSTAAQRAEAFLRTLSKWSTPTPETP